MPAAPGRRHVATARPFVLTAAWLHAGPGRWLRGGGLVIHGERVLAVLPDRAAVQRTTGATVPCVDAGVALLTPGLVVAHAHLELSALAGRVPAGGDFPAWIERLMAARAGVERGTLAAARARAAEALLLRGATTVGDVDSLGLWAERRAWPAADRSPRVVVQRELLDAHDPARTQAALQRVVRPIPRSPRRHEGLAPHAPYTASDALLASTAALAARRHAPLTVHFAETREEAQWLAGRGGPFERLLGARAPGGAGALARLAGAGLLGPRTALVHANHPDPGDVEAIARAGCTVVHCPGAHRFFAREPFAFDTWLAARVPLALGTDSAAGNDALDPLRELALARRAAPHVPPETWLEIATSGGARAVGLEGRAGVLLAGAYADVAAWPLPGDGPGALADALTSGEHAPAAVWVGGRSASG